mgnify:FL=1
MNKIFPRGLFIFLIAFSQLVFLEEDTDESNKILYDKLASLEKEVAFLRSIIEENTFLIERYQELNQQRYLDIDKRLHDLIDKEINKSALEEDKLDEVLVNEELSLYREALDLFDKARYSESLEVFREIIINHPEGNYIADAYFWSGELYLAQNSLEDAKQNFLVVISKYPKHQRSPDSLFKLGVISFKSGQLEDAEEYFAKVVELYPESGSAQLAEKNLENLQK